MVGAFLTWVQTDAAAYLEKAEALSYEIGLRPWEFWRMTPLEFAETVRGYAKREEHEMERTAWQVMHMYALLRRKKPPSVDRLLGRKRKPLAEG